MAPREPEKGRRRRPGFTGARDQTQCRFCRGGIKYIDYKDIEGLGKLLTQRGKIFSRKRSGNSMSDKLAAEVVAAYNEEGGTYKKKEDTHRMAEANKAFAHFRF